MTGGRRLIITGKINLHFNHEQKSNIGNKKFAEKFINTTVNTRKKKKYRKKLERLKYL